MLWGHLSWQALPDVAEAEAPEPISGATRTCLLKMGPQAHCPHFSHLFVTGLTCPSQESHPRFTTSYYKPSPSDLKPGAHPLSLPHPAAACSASAGATFGARNADTRQDYVRHHYLGPHPSTIYGQVRTAAAYWEKLYFHNTSRDAFLYILGLTLPDI